MKTNTALINYRLGSISFCLIFLLCSSLWAQEQTRVRVTGTSISRDKTPGQGFDDALIDAKKNALVKAGISEQLVVSNLLHTFGNEQNIETYFHGISNTEMGANILIDSIYAERNEFDRFGNMIISVEIEAQVYTYENPRDPGFFFDLKELKDIYYDNEFIRFSFTPSHDGYLTIFTFNEDESFVLYPFKNEEYGYLSDKDEQLFVKGEGVSFPLNPAYDPGYSIELTNPMADENSLLLFVFTKQHIPWLQDQISLEAVRSWIYQIPIDQREVVYRNVLFKQFD